MIKSITNSSNFFYVSNLLHSYNPIIICFGSMNDFIISERHKWCISNFLINKKTNFNQEKKYIYTWLDEKSTTALNSFLGYSFESKLHLYRLQ